MNRAEMLRRVGSRSKPWDIIVVGGGATGMGIAVDAALRLYDVLLLERSDFGKGTSSRSTKLLHGGVRYLEQGNIPLVLDALRERELLLRNAPHLVENLSFVVPAYKWWEKAYYGIGLKTYDAMAGRSQFGGTEILSREETLSRVPNIQSAGLRGGIVYHDGAFDDARLLISLAQTAVDRGATLLNYAEVTRLTRHNGGKVSGVTAYDAETGDAFEANARVVINATGPFCDSVRQMADANVHPMVKPSQGIHLVVDRRFLSGKSAMVVPRTIDGRVMFAIPWQGHTLLGTTDTPITSAEEEPRALDNEVRFVLGTAARYLDRAPSRKDVLSVFAGIRPLLRSDDAKATSALARDHTIRIEDSGLVTITGGKWTTYRKMAEDCVDQASQAAGLPKRSCLTRDMPLQSPETASIAALAASDDRFSQKLHPAFPHIAADVIWAVRSEMARTIEDVLARRTRMLFLNAEAAVQAAGMVADLMAGELDWDTVRQNAELTRFQKIASGYLI